VAGGGGFVYVNTSIVVRALNPGEPGHREARRMLEECCRACRCVWSSVHGLDGFRSVVDVVIFQGYLDSLGASHAEVDLEDVFQEAEEYRVSRGLAESRRVDLMHMVAARRLGCRYLLARDRFIWRNSKYFGLTYVNWETHGGKCPCSQLGNGVGSETRRASSNSSSQKSRKPGHLGSQQRRKSSNSGSTARSHIVKRRRGSRSSQTAKPSQARSGKREGG
jgi:predicted nucleic acid-binding protein